MRVVFWGTPEFATASLRALLGEGHDVLAVVTQPDRPVGRHRSTLMAPEVKRVAESEGIHVIQPESSRSTALLDELRNLSPDIFVVVAFGQILPAAIIDLPPHGTINVHASLLPRLRGAAPMQAAIREGLDHTGVTVMQMVAKLDAGPIILQQATPIHADETFGELQLRLSELGALSLIEALILISLGKSDARRQDESEATYAPRITRADARIEWDSHCMDVARCIRAFDPRPGSFTNRGDAEVRLFGARIDENRTGEAGAVLEVGDAGLVVACGSGSVNIAYVHPAGRKRMTALDWLKGRGVAVGDVLGTGS